MLKERILQTLHFFDLQEFPLTLQELYNFLLADLELIRPFMDTEMNLSGEFTATKGVENFSLWAVYACLNGELVGRVEEQHGFYCLPGRGELIPRRLENYQYGLKREKLIKRYVGALRHLPFVRGAALGGSQALGPSRENSDIDLFIITDEKFLALARTIITIYFQAIGRRRHGKKIANRFCLNHYVSRPKELKILRNLYSAMEYLRLRPLVYARAVGDFKIANKSWLEKFFVNAEKLENFKDEPRSRLQRILEKIFEGKFGLWLESFLKNWQVKKIQAGKFIVVEEDEFSFHPNSKQQKLLADFFGSKNIVA